MNYETQKQFSGFNFSCAFCGYASPLNLQECPGCGRLKPSENQKPKRTAGGLDAAFANALPIAERYIYVCEHCCSQTSRQLAECPECGRSKFAKFAAPALRDDADFRSELTVGTKSEIGKFLLILSITLFVGAFLTFLGFGTSGHRRTGSLVAGVGDNWHIALILFSIGIGCVIAGIVLKNSD